MLGSEALDIISRLVDFDGNDIEKQALSVLRAVVEDYEKARPLLDEIHKAEVGNYWTENSDATGKAEFTFYDDRPIVLAALAYRERKERR